MPKIHWVGAGLSAIPGLRHLIQSGHNVIVWNRSVEKARAALHGLEADIRAFSMDALGAALTPGDLVISMLPTNWHLPLAQMALEADAHFLSTSYISPEMRGLDAAARAKGLSFVNEIGLDPGIDHLMAHWLVDDYRKSAGFDAKNALSFISYCGGIPKIPNDFKYKFSWSPLGVLKALASPATAIENGATFTAAPPWEALSSYTAPLATEEAFEVYPNRDSLPFMADYGFDPAWKVERFVRGTLRLEGWAEAWGEIFEIILSAQGAEGEAKLAETSARLWAENAYDAGEPDRVVLCVRLTAEAEDGVVYDKTYALDAHGNAEGSAMARLVSYPLSFAIEAVLAGEMPAGVSAATKEMARVDDWLGRVRERAQFMMVQDHLSA